jgi:fatty acid desaturase
MNKRIDLSVLEKRADWKSWLVACGHVALVLAPVYIAANSGWHWWWILAWAWCGILMNGLLNLMHECAHLHTFRKRELSDFWGRWILGPLALADFDAYRRRHWEHHRHLGVTGDTKDAYLIDISRGRMFGMLLRCLVFLEALGKVKLQMGSGATKQAGRAHRAWAARTMIMQGVFFGTILLAAEGLGRRAFWPDAAVIAVGAYGGIYLYGLATLTVFMANLRAIAEHQLESGECSEHGRAALRNFRCGRISRLVFGAYGFAEHGTHHLEPGIPYYHLPSSTLELAREDANLLPTRGYVDELLLLAKGPVREGRGNAQERLVGRG